MADGTDSTTTGTEGTQTEKKTFKAILGDADSKLARLSCYLYDDLTIFDLRSLESETGYSAQGNTKQANGELTTYYFNFCRRLKITQKDKDGKDQSDETFVYKSTSSGDVALTDKNKPSYTETVLKDSDDDTGHILFD